MQFNLNRRAFIASGSAALLSGCATMGPRRSACAPLVPLRLDEPVLRAIAGLRPYRPSGFVVRRDQLGDKAIVHNYGHGGAGITMSWGSSRLATLLGLPGHSGPVAVLGAGVMGMTTARLVQEAGFPVTIYAAALTSDTTSYVAGGQVMPSTLYRESMVTPAWRQQFAAALDYSLARFRTQIGDHYGIRQLPTYIEHDGGRQPDYVDRVAVGWRDLTRAQHPFPLAQVARYETMYVETGRFLRQLTAELLQAGGHVRVRRFDTPADIATLPETLIFNCTGLGARELFGDEELLAIRGQLAVLAPQPGVDYAFSGRAGYMFPRGDGIILGGTFERGVWDAATEPTAIAEIVDSHRQLFGGFRCMA